MELIQQQREWMVRIMCPPHTSRKQHRTSYLNLYNYPLSKMQHNIVTTYKTSLVMGPLEGLTACGSSTKCSLLKSIKQLKDILCTALTEHSLSNDVGTPKRH
ncbi:hypothetical protein QL285_057196 [Trifolium repens]|nr:hypothetical protein QL285_057196 [Trifolium repens]